MDVDTRSAVDDATPLPGFEDAAHAVEVAAAALTAGSIVVIYDDRSGHGDLVAAAELVTEPQMSFILSHAGMVCAPMPLSRADHLGLQALTGDSSDPILSGVAMSVDACEAADGGSPNDRTKTMHALSDSRVRASDLRQPGYVVPIRARRGGVLVLENRAEAAVDLLTMAGLTGVAATGRIRTQDGSLRQDAELLRFATDHGLPLLRISELIAYRRVTERFVVPVSRAILPTGFGEFQAVEYRNALDGVEHLALTMGDIGAANTSSQGVLVRVHSECVTGDNFGSLRCDCGTQLSQSLAAIASQGRGVLIYLRGHEGRGIGIIDKLRAYELQDAGLDTLDANLALGLPVDAREYTPAAQMLRDLGVTRMRLITHNPAKVEAMNRAGLHVVEIVNQPVMRTEYNAQYLDTKRDRMGHLLLPTPER